MTTTDYLRQRLEAHLQTGFSLCKDIIDRDRDIVADGIGLFAPLVEELLQHENTAQSYSKTSFFVASDKTLDYAYRYALLTALLLAVSHFYPRYGSQPRANLKHE